MANLENVFDFEVIGENMCKYLDCTSILNVKKVSTTLYRAMEKQRVAWIRTVQNRFTIRTGKGELPESWNSIVYKLTTENLKKLGLDLDPIHDSVNIGMTRFHYITRGLPSLADLTLFHFVAGSGDLELYRFLADTYGNPINEDGPEGYTPLHAAVFNGHLDVCHFILDRVQNKNPAVRSGLTPLHLAANRGHEEVFKAIANEIEDKNPGSYSYIAINTPLHEAAIFGHLGICQFILNSLDDKNPSNNNGITPLHLAAWHGHEDVFQAIFNGIEIKNPGNIRGRTPLHHAVSRRNLEMCRFIIDRVDEKNPQDINGVTPLALAHQKRFSEIVELFK